MYLILMSQFFRFDLLSYTTKFILYTYSNNYCNYNIKIINA